MENEIQNTPLLEIKDLHVTFPIAGLAIHAVNGVNLTLQQGETLGVIGESGCGKSVTFSNVLRLLKAPPAIITGSVMLNGRDVMKLSEREMTRVRGKEAAMIFQEPMRSLNPVMKIVDQLTETLLIHEVLTKKEARARALELLKMVEMPDAENRLECYPHQLSGGLRQRVMIAMALACTPQLLIADEPTTALDVTIQAQILDLIRRLHEEKGMGVIFITHDLGIVADIVDKIAVFYAGNIVEIADKRTIFKNPMHPYTIGLMNCIPRLDTTSARLKTIEGSTPDPADLPEGCPFAPRCPYVRDLCLKEKPEEREVEPGHFCRCHGMV